MASPATAIGSKTHSFSEVPPGNRSKLNDFEDVTEKVICKLSALTDIFVFFEYTNDKADFRKKTIAGLYYIIDDCIGDLEGLKK